jgi:release factor glutamine methyltransferase
MTTSEVLQSTHAQHPSIPTLDLQLALAHALGVDRVSILTHSDRVLTDAEASTFASFALRLAQHEPLAYTTGHREFYGLDFAVTPATLIPRPETEWLVERVATQVQNTAATLPIHIADIGTGSGCIITSIAHTLSRSESSESTTYYATDISMAALAVAEGNFGTHNPTIHLQSHSGSLSEPLQKYFQEHSSDTWIFTANLPYVSETEYATLDPNVRDYEPKSALVSDTNGTQHTVELIQELIASPLENFTVYFEIGPVQKEVLEGELPQILDTTLYTWKFDRDLAGLWRYLTVEKK